jgi:hypothetical protein
MQRNSRQQTARRHPPSASATFGYAQVESILAKVFDAEDAQRGAFRGRLKHFRKLGIPAKNPGKGSRLQYSASDLFQLLIALELSEFNIDPNLIVKIVQDHWKGKKGFYAAIQNAQWRSNDDCLAFVSVRFMSASLGQRRVMQSPTTISLRSAPHPVVPRFVWASGVRGANLLKTLQEPGERFCVFNLSARIRAAKKEALAVE